MTVIAKIPTWTVTFGGEIHRGWLPRGAARPKPTNERIANLQITIERDDGGYLLIWEELAADERGDVWYGSLDEAIAAAEEFFGVPKSQWQWSK
jgi:hypothetical protein